MGHADLPVCVPVQCCFFPLLQHQDFASALRQTEDDQFRAEGCHIRCGLDLAVCVAITTLPIYADQLGWAIPEEYTEIFADLVIVGAVLMVSCKYIAEAFTKFRAILQVKGDTENE